MDLRELNIIYSKVENIMNFTDGKIIGLYMIFQDDYVKFAVEIEYLNKDNKKIGLFGFDIENKTIIYLNQEEYVSLLEKIDKVNKGKHYLIIKEELTKCNEFKTIVEYDKYFIIIDPNSKLPSYKSESYVNFNEIKYKIDAKTSVLYCSPNISTVYTKISISNMDKCMLETINYLTIVDVNIKYNEKFFKEYGNIKKTKKTDNELEIIVEPVQATLLETLMLDKMNFSKVTPQEMIEVMLNITNTIEFANEGLGDKHSRKYKYITTLNNFELKSDEIQIADIIFSKSMDDIDVDKIKPNSEKYIYISTYVTAKTISDAQKTAIQKIETALNIMQLIEKNSCFYKLYNEKEDLNEWNVKKIFIDYRMGEKFYIFNIFENEQSVYGSNKEIVIKNYGYINSDSDLILYNDEINDLILNNTNKKNNLPDAIYWLNKGIEEINVDLNKCILYLNIALEYCVNGEKGESFFDQESESKEIFKNICEYMENEYNDNQVAEEMQKKFNEMLSSASLMNRFETMLKRLNINCTKEQKETYTKIRNARNSLIHGRKKVKVQKYDIVQCYMFLSKVMFYRLKERQ